MPCYDNISGTLRKVSKIYDNIGGVLREVKTGYDNIGGVLRQYYSTDVVVLDSSNPGSSGWIDGVVLTNGNRAYSATPYVSTSPAAIYMYARWSGGSNEPDEGSSIVMQRQRMSSTELAKYQYIEATLVGPSTLLSGAASNDNLYANSFGSRGILLAQFYSSYGMITQGELDTAWNAQGYYGSVYATYLGYSLNGGTFISEKYCSLRSIASGSYVTFKYQIPSSLSNSYYYSVYGRAQGSYERHGYGKIGEKLYLTGIKLM